MGVEPIAPDEATYPRAFENTLVSLLIFAGIYLMISLTVSILLSMPIKDSTAGFKCYKKEVLQTINLDKIRFVGYAFQIEMKFTAWKYGFKITEVPIIFTNRVLGESKMSTKILNEAVFGIISMKIRSFFTKYKKMHVQN